MSMNAAFLKSSTVALIRDHSEKKVLSDIEFKVVLLKEHA